MGVWNRPMFKGALPPGSARAELQRMRMQEGGSPFLEQLSGEDRGIVLPEATDRRERARAQREAMRQDAAAKDFSFEMVRGERSPAGPMQAQMQPPQQAALPLAPLLMGGAMASLAYEAMPFINRFYGGSGEVTREGSDFDPDIPPLGQRTGEDRSDQIGGLNTDIAGSLAETRRRIEEQEAREAAAAAAAGAGEGETPAVGQYRPPPRPSEGAGEAPVVSAEEQEAAPGLDISGLLGMYTFSPEERTERLRAAYEGREQIYDEILGDPERRRSMAKAQLLFSIAQRALQFASGVSPEGQPMSGSMLSQAARSFAPVAGDLATYASQMETEDRELRLARLAAAEKDVDAAEKSRAALLAALAKARGEDDSKVLTELPTAQQIIEGVTIQEAPDLTSAYAFGSTIISAFAKGARAFNIDLAPETSEATRWAKQFNTTVLADLASSIQSSRPSNFALELAGSLLPEPGATFESVASAIDTYSGLRDQLNRDINSLAEDYMLYRQLGMAKDAIQTQSLMRRARETSLQLESILSGLRGEMPEEQAQALGNVAEGPDPNEAE